jgi:hypothetical protein
MTLDGTLILMHGGAMALVTSGIVMGLLRYNPRLFLKHFSEKVRASQPPLNRQETINGTLLGLPLFAALVGFPVWSALEFGKTGADALSIWSHAFLVGMVFNLVDWLVLDELWLGVGKPRWALPPGAIWADALPFEHGRHFADFLKGVIVFAVVACIATGVVLLARPTSSAGVV